MLRFENSEGDLIFSTPSDLLDNFLYDETVEHNLAASIARQIEQLLINRESPFERIVYVPDFFKIPADIGNDFSLILDGIERLRERVASIIAKEIPSHQVLLLPQNQIFISRSSGIQRVLTTKQWSKPKGFNYSRTVFKTTICGNSEFYDSLNCGFEIPDHEQILRETVTFSVCPERRGYLVSKAPELEEVTDIKSANLELEPLLKALCDIIDGIIHLHSHGIVHGDINPRNLFYIDGRGYLGDLESLCLNNTSITPLRHRTTPNFAKYQYDYTELDSDGKCQLNFEYDIFGLIMSILDLIKNSKYFDRQEFWDTGNHTYSYMYSSVLLDKFRDIVGDEHLKNPTCKIVFVLLQAGLTLKDLDLNYLTSLREALNQWSQSLTS